MGGGALWQGCLGGREEAGQGRQKGRPGPGKPLLFPGGESKPGFVGKEGGTVKQRTQQNVKVRGSEDQKGGELHEQAFVTYPAKSAQGPSSPLDKEKKEIMTL